MSPDLDKKLCETYPLIFADRNSKPSETLMCWGFSCDDGWYSLLTCLCDHIQTHCNNKADVPQVVAVQVKEKFGGLRFYYRGGDDYIRSVVDLAEMLSTRICEVCGDHGKRESYRGYIQTLCDKHSEERA